MLALACNSEKKEEQRDDSTSITATDTTLVPSVPVEEKVTECYSYIKNRDTATLKINTENEELTGNLAYKLFEKDSNKGTIAGEMKGDTIIAEYIFNSEGRSSIREIVLLRKDGKLYEGYGDVEERKGKMVFKDRSKLKFGDAIVFSKTDCQ
ncbi:hypothetical protein EZ437_07205 [Pedobacter psychroterrae]|uniref:Uncharacterized protein n=1 Tax=Pedobacter psychroterrae TaxID=2530453 RepID=A0A4R0NS97_9SPHI|nr:hypothetical protein EZ437_07205 [Pedobacter psychroterrae]